MRWRRWKIAARKIYAVEFHPEVNHTEQGTEILRNFCFGCARRKRSGAGQRSSKRRWRRFAQKAGPTSQVICALSGGVDSTVAAALVHRAIGDRLTNIFVNTGILRKNEFADTLEMLRERLGLQVIGVDASDRFLARLEGVSDPETKRKSIGGEFIAVFEEEALRLQREEAHGDIEYPGAGDALSRT